MESAGKIILRSFSGMEPRCLSHQYLVCRAGLIRRFGGRELGRCGVGWFAARFDARRNSYRNAVGRHIGDHHCIGADRNVVSDMDRAKDLGAGSDIDAMADRRSATMAGVAQAYRDPVTDYAVVAKARIPADHNAAKVIDAETAPERDFAGQLDAG